MTDPTVIPSSESVEVSGGTEYVEVNGGIDVVEIQLASTVDVVDVGTQGPVGPQGETGPAGADASVVELDDIGNVTITSNTSGELLVWNGSAWVNNTAAEASLSEVGHTHTESDITDLGSYIEASEVLSSIPNADKSIILDDDSGVPIGFIAGNNSPTLGDFTSMTFFAGHYPGLGGLLGFGAGDGVTSLDVFFARSVDGGSPAMAVLDGGLSLVQLMGDDPRAGISGVQDFVTRGYADSNYSAASHTHTESDITDLQSYLLDVTGESLSDLSDVTITSIASGELLKWTGAAWENNTLAEAGISATGHTHTESDITDLDHSVDVVSNVAQDTILGRTTAGSGDSEELTAADVRTLINVEDGSTADQTPAELLTAIKTVDGASSGLDADLLDGNEASAFATAGHTHAYVDESGDTMTGQLLVDLGSDTTGIVVQADAAQTADLVAVQDSVGSNKFTVSSSGVLGGNGTRLLIGQHLRPNVTNQRDLGSTGNRWKDVWFAGTLSGSEAILAPTAAGDIPLTITAHASQTADLLKLQSNAGSDIFAVEADGDIVLDDDSVGIYFGSSGSNQSIIGNAGHIEIRPASSRATYLKNEGGDNALIVGTDVNPFQVRIEGHDATTDEVLVLKGQASQSGNMLSVHDSSDTELFSVTSAGYAHAPDGAVGTPSLSFISDTDTGLFSDGADSLGIALGGALFGTIENNAVIGVDALHVGDYSGGAHTAVTAYGPAIFDSSGNTKVYLLDFVGTPLLQMMDASGNGTQLTMAGTSGLALTAIGSGVAELTAKQIHASQALTGASDPVLTIGATDTGFAAGLSDVVTFSQSGTEVFRWASTGATLPGAHATYDLGNSIVRWLTIYGHDLNLSNDITFTASAGGVIRGQVVDVNDNVGYEYTLVLADAGQYVRLDDGAATPNAVICHVPTNANVAFPVGTVITVRQVAGQVEVRGQGGVTINTPETLLLRAAGSTAQLVKVATNEWDLMGDLEAA